MNHQILTISYLQTKKKHLPEVEKKLCQMAQEAYENAYVPYSQFQVGAAALLSNGTMAKGCNVENASYPVTLCAERNLLAHIHQYYPNTNIQTIAVTFYQKGNTLQMPISPCGMCRQALLEFEMQQKQSIKILLCGMGEDMFIIHSAKDLLPFSFTAAYLQ